MAFFLVLSTIYFFAVCLSTSREQHALVCFYISVCTLTFYELDLYFTYRYILLSCPSLLKLDKDWFIHSKRRLYIFFFFFLFPLAIITSPTHHMLRLAVLLLFIYLVCLSLLNSTGSISCALLDSWNCRFAFTPAF